MSRQTRTAHTRSRCDAAFYTRALSQSVWGHANLDLGRALRLLLHNSTPLKSLLRSLPQPAHEFYFFFLFFWPGIHPAHWREWKGSGVVLLLEKTKSTIPGVSPGLKLLHPSSPQCVTNDFPEKEQN
jgi:hypothetical protein